MSRKNPELGFQIACAGATFMFFVFAGIISYSDNNYTQVIGLLILGLSVVPITLGLRSRDRTRGSGE